MLQGLSFRRLLGDVAGRKKLAKQFSGLVGLTVYSSIDFHRPSQGPDRFRRMWSKRNDLRGANLWPMASVPINSIY
jgi:hypothetical protein